MKICLSSEKAQHIFFHMTEDQGRCFFGAEIQNATFNPWFDQGQDDPPVGDKAGLAEGVLRCRSHGVAPGERIFPAFLGKTYGKVLENRGNPMINDDQWRLIAGKILIKEELIMEKYENVRCNRCQWRSIAWRHPKIEDFLASHVWLPEGTGHLYFHPCFVMTATVYCNSSLDVHAEQLIALAVLVCLGADGWSFWDS